MTTRQHHKVAQDFLDCLSVLQTNLVAFDGGPAASYRVLATELRKLLCDKAGSTLLPRVFRDPRLHKFHWTKLVEQRSSIADKLVFQQPGSLETHPGKQPRFELKFATPTEVMPLDDWLQQPMFNSKITVRELIKSVADKEGAHADPDYNETLLFAKGVKFVEDDSHQHAIAAIARYLVAFIAHEPLEIQPGIPLSRPAQGAS